jgi:DNA polymerase-3 subunit epsilon
MSWAFGQLAPFDTETSGPDPMQARLVSATVAHIAPGRESAITERLVAVEEDIPAEATEVHGITTEHARAHGKPLPEVAEALASQVVELMRAGVPLVGMNLVYDTTLLEHELHRCGLPTLTERMGGEVSPLIDVFVMDKALDRFRPGKRKLTDLCEFYGVRLDGAHDATFDALGAARVAYKMCRRAEQAVMDPQAVHDLYADRPRQAPHIVRMFQQLAGMPLADLHAQQAVWYREQATGLAAYWRQKANQLEHEAGQSGDDAERGSKMAEAEELRTSADGVTTDWPMRPLGGTR